MPASTITRLQTPLRTLFLNKLSRNFRPLGQVGDTKHGRRDWRDSLVNRAGIIVLEANVKSVANHTVEISGPAASSFAATGGTPASGTVTGGASWDEIDYAAAGLVTVTATHAAPAQGQREVLVP